MKLSTNYSKSDWYRLGLSLFLIFIIPLSVTVYCIVSLWIPYLDMWGDYLKFSTERDDVKFFKDWATLKGWSIDQMLIFWGLLWGGGVGFSITIILILSAKLMNFMLWVVKKIDIIPKMKLVVFWNGKPIRRLN